MPYVTRDENDLVNAVYNNDPNGQYEPIDATDLDLLFYYESRDKINDLSKEFKNRTESLHVMNRTYSLTDPIYTNFGRMVIQGLIAGSSIIYLPDHKGVLYGHTTLDASSIATTLQNYLNLAIENEIALRDAINSCQDYSDLNAIDVTQGWPATP